jgi:hypothetical protein
MSNENIHEVDEFEVEEVLEAEEEEVEEELEAEEEIEESAASETLKPGGGSGGMDTKSGLINKLISMTAGMSKQDLSSFLEKTLAQVGNEGAKAPAAAGKNKSSVQTSGAGTPNPILAKSVKEDVEGLFEGEELSEEFMEKTSTLFEAAVNNRVAVEMENIQEKLDEEIEKQVTESIDELHENISNYMDYVVEKWMEENTLVIESEMKSEVTEGFIEGLKSLFAEHYVDVPEDKVDLVSSLSEELENTISALEESENQRIHLESLVKEAEVEVAFDDVTEGLTDTEIEKLKTLSEGLEYDTIEEYEEKLNVIKDQYFNKETIEESSSSTLINEDVAGTDPEVEEEVQKVPVEMRGYADAISRTIRK